MFELEEINHGGKKRNDERVAGDEQNITLSTKHYLTMNKSTQARVSCPSLKLAHVLCCGRDSRRVRRMFSFWWSTVNEAGAGGEQRNCTRRK
jgi:hypothetical protein